MEHRYKYLKYKLKYLNLKGGQKKSKKSKRSKKESRKMSRTANGTQKELDLILDEMCTIIETSDSNIKCKNLNKEEKEKFFVIDGMELSSQIKIMKLELQLLKLFH